MFNQEKIVLKKIVCLLFLCFINISLQTANIPLQKQEKYLHVDVSHNLTFKEKVFLTATVGCICYLGYKHFSRAKKSPESTEQLKIIKAQTEELEKELKACQKQQRSYSDSLNIAHRIIIENNQNASDLLKTTAELTIIGVSSVNLAREISKDFKSQTAEVCKLLDKKKSCQKKIIDLLQQKPKQIEPHIQLTSRNKE